MPACAVHPVPARPPRNTPPVFLPNATQFSAEDGAFFDPVQLVRRVRGMSDVYRLLQQTRIDHHHGPARGSGDWALAYLAFVVGREPGVKPWCQKVARPAMWRACGFTSSPGWQTVYERFCELEQFADVFQAAAHLLVQKARGRDARIGMWVSVDGTEVQTHSQRQHDCHAGDDCPTHGRHVDAGTIIKTPGDAAELRAEESVLEETAAGAAPAPAPVVTTPGLTPIPPDGTIEETRDGIRISAGGHWWRTRDKDAGVRTYTNRKTWQGYFNIKAVDVVTGAALAVDVIPASTNEVDALPAIYDQTVQAIGGIDPIALIADRGYAFDEVHEFLINRDCTPVIPYRRRTSSSPTRAPAGPRFDAHGVPCCEHCDLPGDFVRFSAGKEGHSPRVWFRCPLPTTDGCQKDQSIRCSESIRRILPIWRTSPVYSALRNAMGVYERAHEEFRVNFRVGGKTLRDRQRRIGIPCQRLRAQAALLVEWVWVLARQGWLTDRDGNPNRPERAQMERLPLGRMLANVLSRRHKKHMLGGGYPVRGGPLPQP